jgi:hypothetical protein
LKWRGRSNEPIRTWGGREYYCEPPKFVEEVQPLADLRVQAAQPADPGSAADNTKQATINYHEHPKRTARFLLTVHDEFPRRRRRRIGSTSRRR